MRKTTGSLLLLATTLALSAGCLRVPPPAIEPLSAEEHNDLGLVYYRGGEYAAAAREFRAALAGRPGFTRALVNLGDAELAGGALDAALEAYERARAASPDDPGLANNLAWALLQHDWRWPEAEPLIRDALAQSPEPRGYYLDTLGVLLLRKEAPGAALAAFRAALADVALSDRETRRLILRHAGDALARLGEHEGAERCYQLARGLASKALAEVGASDTVC